MYLEENGNKLNKVLQCSHFKQLSSISETGVRNRTWNRSKNHEPNKLTVTNRRQWCKTSDNYVGNTRETMGILEKCLEVILFEFFSWYAPFSLY